MKKEIYLPDYKGKSIVNLMSSIGGALGWTSPYKQLKALPSLELKKYKNIILIMLDGLGYEYLKSKPKSFLYQHMKGKMTSVFLPSTSCAVTTFLTGVAPQQHAFTGWFVYLKEIGLISIPLPFVTRGGGHLSLSTSKFDIKDILDEKGFTEKIKADSYIINPKGLEDTSFTNTTGKKAKMFSYTTLNGMFRTIKTKIKPSKKKKYFYCYIPIFDSNSHEYGVESKKTEKIFKKIDNSLNQFFHKFKDKNTLFIISSDHGFMDTPLNKRIILKDHPKLKECLTMPLCGDSRVKYCYVHPSKTKDFEKYVRTRLKKYCKLYKSRDLIKKNIFGLGKPNPKLFDRIGDYILIMKKNYAFKDFIVGEKDHKHIGHHGGLSKQEMFVPLILIEG